MDRTAIQLDMTAFYSADEALHALRAGRSTAFGSLDFQTGMAYLALIVSSACLFDTIAVAVPAVLDSTADESEFAPDASELSEVLKQSGVVNVLTLNDDQKSAATGDLVTLAEDYCMSIVGFVTSLTQPASDASGRWAVGQLNSPVIKRHTDAEEGASAFHRKWTTALVEDATRRIEKLDGAGHAANWSQTVLRYVVNNLARGFIYEVAGAQAGTFYLPYFIREGLLSHTKDNRPRAKAATELCSLVMDQADLARVFGESRPAPEGINFGKAAILRELEAEANCEPQSISGLISAERDKDANKELRERLRAANERDGAEQTAAGWVRALKRDHEVWEGKKLPALLEVIPKAAQLVPGVDATKVSALLDTIAPGLRSNSQFWQMLRHPIYARKHMRYLWKRFR